MLTPTKQKVLKFINTYTDKKGYSPTLEEIRNGLRLNSISTIHQHIKELENSGHLNKKSKLHRSIEIPKHEGMIKISLLGTISAGEPIEAVQEREIIAVPKSKVDGAGEVYALRVQGDSMIDEGIFDGDTVIVRKQNTVEDGETAVALINNNEVTLKKIYKEKNRIRLQPANPSLKPFFVKEVIIQGKVISTFRNIEEQENKEGKTKLNNIYRSDCIEFMKSMDENSIDLTVTSPPYDELRDYKGYSFDFENIAKQLFRVTKKGGVVVWVVGDKIKKGNKTLTSFKQSLFFQQIG